MTKSKYVPHAPWSGPGWYLIAAEWHGEEMSNHGTIGADTPVQSGSPLYEPLGCNGYFGTPAVILAYVHRDPVSGTRITHSFGHPWPEGSLIAGPIRHFADLQSWLEALRAFRSDQALKEAAKKFDQANVAAASQAKFPWHKS